MRHLTGARLFYFLRRWRVIPAGATGPTHSRRHRIKFRAGYAAAALLAFAALIAVACGGGSDSSVTASGTPRPLKKVTFMAGFKAQANLPFVGAYVAQEKGFFREQGLEVTIRHAQSGEHLQLLLAGEIQFTTANGASVLKRNAQDLHVVSIALIGQKSETGFAVLANSGINSVNDWSGKTLGFKGSVPPEFLAITRANGLDPAKVKQVSVGFDPRILAEGRIDILPVFFSNEPGTLADVGVKTKVFDPNDYGIDSLGLTFITTAEYIEKDPDTVGRFVKAVLKGIEYADQHREEAVDIVMKYAPDEDRNHQKFMMETELARAQTDLTRTNGLGWQTQAQWQRAHDSLLEFKGIDKPVDVTKVFADQFLKQAYKNGKLVWP